MSAHITIDVESGGDFDLDEIWPDGDAPKHPTAQDVVAVFQKEGPALLSDMDLHFPARISICVVTDTNHRTYADLTL